MLRRQRAYDIILPFPDTTKGPRRHHSRLVASLVLLVLDCLIFGSVLMFDPLASSPFADDTSSIPPWPTTPHTPGSPIPNLRRSQPQTPIHVSTSLDGTTSPYRKEPQIYGQPESGLISPTTNKGVNGKMYEKQEPYLRARITMLDRNRRDILIRFDAQVWSFFFF